MRVNCEGFIVEPHLLKFCDITFAVRCPNLAWRAREGVVQVPKYCATSRIPFSDTGP